MELEEGLTSALHRVDKWISIAENEADERDLHLQTEYLLTELDMTVSQLRNLRHHFNDNSTDWLETESLADVFQSVLHCVRNYSLIIGTDLHRGIIERFCERNLDGPGRPSIYVPSEILEELRAVGFTWSKIAKTLGISRWTVMRRVREYGLDGMQGFSSLSDNELDSLVNGFIDQHGSMVGQTLTLGYLKSRGLQIQRNRVRQSLVRVSPDNSILRWGAVISRRVYYVPWPNSIWHIDGHHSLIRWGFVVHGCIDGFSRKVMFLHCNTNNQADTVLHLFLEATSVHQWPSRIRVDRGVENVSICDAMVAARGAGRGSYIAGPSTRNQRIERLWRDVFRCVCYIFYYVFYGMEQSQILDVENNVQMWVLQKIFLPRINQSLYEFMSAFNEHKIRTAGYQSPNQMWLAGMLNPLNPLSHENLDDGPEDLTVYGEDPEGPSPFEDTNNNVVVSEASIPNSELMSESILQNVNPLAESTEMGIDLYLRALTIAEEHLAEGSTHQDHI